MQTDEKEPMKRHPKVAVVNEGQSELNQSTATKTATILAVTTVVAATRATLLAVVPLATTDAGNIKTTAAADIGTRYSNSSSNVSSSTSRNSQ